MPELPDVEALVQTLRPQLVGQTVEAFRLFRPLVMRALPADLEPKTTLKGRRVTDVGRRGKMLVLEHDDGLWLVVSFMLAGTLVYRSLKLKPRVRDYYGLRYANGIELVYHDPKGMGKTYLTKDLRQVPGFFEMGPDALAPDLSLETFLTRLDAHRGEIKGVLTRERVVSGIGSAYADEILFEARIYPFRKCKSLSTEERTALYFAMRDVLTDRVAFLIPRMRDRLDLHDRVGLRIHGRAGESCVRCGGRVSEIAVARRPTHFCRTCQPGLLIGQ